MGRRPELAELRRNLAVHRVVTLVGPAGSGKTRLALELARRSAAQGAEVAFTELAIVSDAGRVIPSTAASIGTAPDLPRTAEELSAWLRGRDLLLVLDNCEHLRTACAELVADLARLAPHVRILATSREPLAIPAESLFQVRPLSLPSADERPSGTGRARSDAVRLFEDRARFAFPGFELDEATTPLVAQLCLAVGGLPLAIELAAARLRHISLEEISARLGDQLRLLVEDARSTDARQRTMRGAIDWSFALLSGRERRVFRRLSVFVGGFALDAAESVCTDTEIAAVDVLPILSSLVDRSLVTADTREAPARYSMLEVLGQYAREKLSEADEEGLVEQRRARFFARLSAQGDIDRDDRSVEYVRRFVLDHANVREAVAWLFRNDPPAVRSILAHAWHVYVFLGPGMDPSEIEDWLVRGLAVEPSRDAFRARMLLGLSIRLSLKDPDRAVAAAREALEIATAVGDERARGGALYRLGALRLARGERLSALGLFDRAVTALRLTSPAIAAWTLATRGQVRGELGDPTGARGDFDAALAICEQYPGRRRLRAIVRSFEARHELREGHHDTAEAAFRDVVRIFREIGSEVPLARALDGLAVIATARGHGERAVRLAGAAEIMRERGGDTLPRTEGDEAALRAVADRLGEKAAQLRSDGRRMPTAEAVAYALSGRERARTTELTRREHEIAGLVARGHTNREIAQQLSISERTVETHVQHILARLDLRTRAAIAHWASEHGGVMPSG